MIVTVPPRELVYLKTQPWSSRKIHGSRETRRNPIKIQAAPETERSLNARGDSVNSVKLCTFTLQRRKGKLNNTATIDGGFL